MGVVGLAGLSVSETATRIGWESRPTYARRYALFTLVGTAAKTISMRRSEAVPGTGPAERIGSEQP